MGEGDGGEGHTARHGGVNTDTALLYRLRPRARRGEAALPPPAGRPGRGEAAGGSPARHRGGRGDVPRAGSGDCLAILSAPFPPPSLLSEGPLPSPHYTPPGPPHTLTSATSCRPRFPTAPPSRPPSATMLRDGAAPLPSPCPGPPRRAAQLMPGMTQQARPRGYRGAQRHAAPRPPPQRPQRERRGPRYLVCPDAASADAPCLPSSRQQPPSLPFNYQLKPQHRAAPRPPPPPPNPFQRREGEAAGLLSPGAGAPPGPARLPRPDRRPPPRLPPPAQPPPRPSARTAPCARRGRRSAFGIPPPGSSPLGPS